MLSFLLWAQAPQAMMVGVGWHDSLLCAKLCIQNQGYSEATWCCLGKSYQKRLGFTVFEFTLVFGNKPFESLSPLPSSSDSPHSVSPHSEGCWEISNRVCKGRRVTRTACGSCIKFEHMCVCAHAHTYTVSVSESGVYYSFSLLLFSRFW